MKSLKGAAAEAVRGFSVVQENYQPVLKTLTERFGHPQVILEAHIRSLIHLPNLTSEDSGSMRKFYDKVIGHVRSVDSMGDKFAAETLAPVLVPLVVDKLPKRVVEKWELEVKDVQDNYLSTKALFTFLEQIIRAKESAQPSPPESKQRSKMEATKDGPPKYNSQRKSSTFALCASTRDQRCCVCRQNHKIWSCVSFLSLSVKERYRKVLSKGLCFLCLEAGHTAEKCQGSTCKYCQSRHHSLIHSDSPKQPASLNTPTSGVASNSIAAKGVNTGKVVLQTIPAILCGANGFSRVVRCFLDPGSQTSFVKEDIVNELGLDGKSVKIAVTGFGGGSGKCSDRKRIAFSLAPIDKPARRYDMEALTVEVICQPAEAVDLHPKKWAHLQDIRFPESFPRKEQEIEVLIGMDFYYMFTTWDVVRGGLSEPVAVRTMLGWIFCGPTGDPEEDCVSSTCMHFQVAPDEQLNNTLQKFWDLESLGIATEESPVSANDDSVILKFKENLTRQDGRYMVPIPWKDQHAELKDNYQQAETRLRSLEKKLIRDRQS